MNKQSAFDIQELGEVICIYPWRPMRIRRYFKPQLPDVRLPFKANILKNASKYKFWSTRQHLKTKRRDSIHHEHFGVPHCVRAANMKGLSLVRDNSAMGVVAAKKSMREFFR